MDEFDPFARKSNENGEDRKDSLKFDDNFVEKTDGNKSESDPVSSTDSPPKTTIPEQIRKVDTPIVHNATAVTFAKSVQVKDLDDDDNLVMSVDRSTYPDRIQVNLGNFTEATYPQSLSTTSLNEDTVSGNLMKSLRNPGVFIVRKGFYIFFVFFMVRPGICWMRLVTDWLVSFLL